ncbi:MAG: response regulator transcription factor [Actinobacteria bacterium]|nr:response regulator transcription factor [Actinomycetota bacterium]
MVRERVLVVDDDPDIRRLVAAYLRTDGFEVLEASDGELAIRLEATEQPDLVVLDLMLPGTSGLEVLRGVRARGPRPVVLLTARDDVTDKVLGLELGADDYVTKPFHPRELVARIRTVLRRSTPPAATTLRRGDLWLDLGRREVRAGDRPVDLTRTEFDLLAALAQADGRVLRRAQLLAAVAGRDAFTLERSVDSHIRNLRRKLEPDAEHPTYVVTVKGVGYRLGVR